MPKKVLNLISNKLPFVFLLLFAFGVMFVSIKINVFRFYNFDLGKFDLGNMTQMVWNTLNGRFMYLTDYFGTNLPRWAMSHVDPILLLTVPFFIIFPHPLTLVILQLIAVISCSFIIYKIADLELGNKFTAMLFGLVFLLYPATGFILAWTAFHGITFAMPFFLAAFYLFEKMYKEGLFTKNRLILFWTFLVITMSGKEEIPLFIFMMGLFFLIFRNGVYTNLRVYLSTKVAKQAIAMMVVSLAWFITAFFIIIPAYADIRVNGYEEFAQEVQIDSDTPRNVVAENYFLSRYDEFGDSYAEVLKNMILHPVKLLGVFFNGDKPENMRMTFDPLAYTPFLYPPLFAIALPEFLINYSITGGGIGTSEIFNHRISLIIPVLMLASIYGVSYIGDLAKRYLRLNKKTFVAVLVFGLLILNINRTLEYQNPIYLWAIQAVQKRIPSKVFAFSINQDAKEVLTKELEIGDRYRLAEFEKKDRECAAKVVKMIPDEASVSGPDYLGAHLSMRETYAIFPALYSKADYVVVDIFAKKVVELLEIEDYSLVSDIVARIMKNPDYELKTACGNLFVFERVGPHGKDELLPIQENFTYEEKLDAEIFFGLHLVDFDLPQEFHRGVPQTIQYVYTRKNSEQLHDYVLFTTFVDVETGEVFQVPNLPSFALSDLESWNENVYYTEDIEIAIPEFVEPGKYKVFVGITNYLRTRSIYIGEAFIL